MSNPEEGKPLPEVAQTSNPIDPMSWLPEKFRKQLADAFTDKKATPEENQRTLEQWENFYGATFVLELRKRLTEMVELALGIETDREAKAAWMNVCGMIHQAMESYPPFGSNTFFDACAAAEKKWGYVAVKELFDSVHGEGNYDQWQGM